MRTDFIKHIFTFLFILVISSDSFAASPYDAEADQFIHQFINAYEKKDLNALMDFYAPNALAIGTGSAEILNGKDEIRKSYETDFMQSLNVDIQIKKIAVISSHHYVFITYLLNTNVNFLNQQPFQATLRFSAVLTRQHEKLSILQSHLSAALENQKPGDSFPNINNS